MPASDRPFDLTLFGATGYTGRLVSRELVRAQGEAPFTFALAGRDRAKLERARDELGVDVPILVGDAADRAALDAITSRSRVVISTVGPYALYGSELVASCVAAGTDYCDLTGEAHWIRRMIDAHHEEAVRTGARIVHTAGFDSIPSDLGVFMLQDHARRAHGRTCRRITAYFGEMSGGASGGTVASLFNILEEARRDRAVRRVLADPYGLDPAPPVPAGGDASPGSQVGVRRHPPSPDRLGLGYDHTLGAFTAPFVMASINTRVVRRTNALTGYAYGEDFEYREVMSTGSGLVGLGRGLAVTAAVAGIGLAAMVPPLAAIVRRGLPRAGEGPTPEARAKGFFVARLIGELDAVGDAPAATLYGRVSDRHDPGYGSTSRMLAATGLALAFDDRPQGAKSGGITTPAAALGEQLLLRLRALGMTWEVGDARSILTPPRRT